MLLKNSRPPFLRPSDFFNRVGQKQTFKPLAKYTIAKIALKILVQLFRQEKGRIHES